MKRMLVVLALAFVPTQALQAQGTGRITGVVTSSENGQALAGVSVQVVGTQLGAVTESGGRYTIAGVPAGRHSVRAVLLGYGDEVVADVSVTAGAEARADFSLRREAIQLEEIVAVGYGQQQKLTLTGSVSAVSGETLARIPAVNVSNTLGGKLAGVVTVNPSGEPGYDGASIRIRGNHTLNDNNPLVVIDGVAGRSGGLERLSPDDIESISVLKDASAAIYGSRAANGVILITTKRGVSQEGKPQLTASFNQGFNQPTRIPKMADAATYMTMLNEIDRYRNREERYSQELIQRYREGGDPWMYPNTDWFDAVIKPVSYQSVGHVALRGSTDRIGYYLSLGGLTEDGYYRNSGTRYNQYSFRSNLDGQVTDHLTLRFDVSGRYEDRNFPTRSAGSIFRSLMRGKPNLPAYWPNGLPGPDIEYGDNPVVIGTPATGYDNDERYYLQGNLGVELTLPGVKGLTLRGAANYDQLFRYFKQWRTPWTLYTWDYVTRDANGEPVLTPATRGFNSPELAQNDARYTGILLNFVSEYRRDFGPHTLGVMAGIERQTADSSYIDAFRKNFLSAEIDELFAGGDAEKNNFGTAPVVAARQNYFTRLNYDFQDKYLFEFVGRYDGSYIFPQERRFGFFPGISAGWRISEEPFFRNRVPLFDELKVRASWGRTGNDRIDAWQYIATYGFGSGYVFGVDEEAKSIYQTRTPNPNITWEVANQLDVGLEGRLFDNRLSFELDYFNEQRTNILWWRNASVPQTTGLTLPRENIGEVASWGWDGSLGWRHRLSDAASYDATFTFGYSQNRINFWDEPPGAPEWQRSTGSRICVPNNCSGLYYKAIGVFKDQAAVDAYPHWPGARPGDIIFEDVDGNNEIDANDRVRVDASGDPTFTAGLTLGGQFRNFDVTASFLGATGAVQYLRTESGDIGNFLQDFAEKRWTPENPNDQHPRTFNRNDEYWVSNDNTYFLRDADYLRLRSLEIGYRLPNALTSRMRTQDMRVYVSGFNLLTWDRFALTDPESRNSQGHYYPQKRVFNVGASVTF
jgi:TonB-dependent starch-binding outer membrane protein SusC